MRCSVAKPGAGQSRTAWTELANAVVSELRAVASREDLETLVADIAREMGFRYYALAHHADHSRSGTDLVQIKAYPEAIFSRLATRQRFRRDPVVRACLRSGGAFLWSDLGSIVELDARDRAILAVGASEGLNEGITVPYARLGDHMGSCTFAGTTVPAEAHRYLGTAQMIGIFAFQAALRLTPGSAVSLANHPRLHPRPRDCVVLAGRGYSNKEIARALDLAPRTVDGYLSEARALFGAHDRTELVVSAVLAGEVDLAELMRRQPR